MTEDRKDIKILIVEDFETIRRIEAKTLQSLGYAHVRQAGDGHEAIQIMDAEPDIRLIISDWNMPVKSGLELLKWIRSDSRFDDVVFIMATSHGDRAHTEEAIREGASGLIGKPFNGDELQDKIDEAFGAKQVNTAEEIYESSLRSPKTESGKTLLRAAHIQITDHLVLGMLSHLISTGELTPRYFELETMCLSSWNLVEQAIEKGTAEIAFMLAPIAMDMFGAGSRIKMILLTHKNGSIFVRNKRGVYVSPREFFKSRAVLIPHKMSIHHMLSHMFFQNQGMTSGMVGDPDIDVAFEVVAPVMMPGHLEQNVNSAGFMVAEPIGSLAVNGGIAERQFLSGEVWDNHPCCVAAVRNDFIERHEDAVYEFTEMLVEAGKRIELQKDLAAEVGVKFLDPNGELGIEHSIIRKLFDEHGGLRTSDLFPRISDFDRIQSYMNRSMKIGTAVDLEKFIDIRFAESACRPDSEPPDRSTPVAKIQRIGPLNFEEMHLLLVEDSKTMRQIESAALSSIGFKDIIQASNGAEAVDILNQREDIDIVISDWNMPEKDGYELLEWIRADKRYADLPFLMATSHGDRGQTEKALRAGADALIPKPFDKDELRWKIEETFGVVPGVSEKETASEKYVPKTKAGKAKIRIGHIQITDHLVLGALNYLVQQGHVQPERFEIVPELTTGWNVLERKLEKGDVDAAFVLAPIAMDMFAAGAPISMLLLAHKNGSIFVRNSGRNDFGKENFFKRTSFLIPHKMSIHHMLSHMYFKSNGLSPGFIGQSDADVFFEVVDPIQMPQYLKENPDASGFMVAEPLGSRAIEAGIAQMEFLSGAIWENHPCCVVAMRNEFILRHEDAVYELIEKLVQAGRWIDANPIRASEIGVHFLDPAGEIGVTAPLLRKVLTGHHGLKTGDLYPQSADFERIQRYMIDEMNIDLPLKLDRFMDVRFADTACKSKTIGYEKGISSLAADIPMDPTAKASHGQKDRLLRLSDGLVRLRDVYGDLKEEADSLDRQVIAELDAIIRNIKHRADSVPDKKTEPAPFHADTKAENAADGPVQEEDVTVLMFNYGDSVFAVPLSSIRRIEPVADLDAPSRSKKTGEEIVVRGVKALIVRLEDMFDVRAGNRQNEMLLLFTKHSGLNAAIGAKKIKDIRKVKVALQTHTDSQPTVSGIFSFEDRQIPVLDVTKLIERAKEIKTKQE